MAPTKLNARIVSTLKPGERVRDTAVRGLFVEAGKTGASFKVQADLWQGPRGAQKLIRTVRVTIGRVGELSVGDARTRAQALLADIKNGVDPRGDAKPAGAGMWDVDRLYAEYAEDLRIRGKSERTITDLTERYKRYLASDWGPVQLDALTRTMAREAHARITREHGPVVANDTLRSFRACFNFARRTTDLGLGENPVEAVSFNPQRQRKDVLSFPDLPDWLSKARALPNPLRAAMHELGLFSGLRPGTLVALERAWVHLEERAIRIPAERMKARRAFDLPLSGHMVELVRRALAAGDVMFPGAPYLFPTRAHGGAVIATQTWKERTLRSETGHVLRHMFSNACNAAGVKSVDRMLLMGQKVPGIEGCYVQDRAQFGHLLAEQERVTAFLLSA